MNQAEKPFYSPSEVAHMLGVSVDQLRQMRWQGRIAGTSFGNSTVYTMEQIKAAYLTPWPRGRKSKRVKKNAASVGTHDSPMMLMAFGQARPEGSGLNELIA